MRQLNLNSIFATTAGPRLRCFLSRELFWLVAIVFFLVGMPTISLGQLVEVPCKGSVAESADRHEELCKQVENTVPNLIVPRKTRVWGLLIDPTGAPFARPEKGLTVQLRDPKTARVISSSVVSDMGTFELGSILPGRYRIIAVLMVNGEATRFRGWVQPQGLACGESDECPLATTLKAGGSDNPIDFCPPQ